MGYVVQKNKAQKKAGFPLSAKSSSKPLRKLNAASLPPEPSPFRNSCYRSGAKAALGA
jgi:hypothetical protein